MAKSVFEKLATAEENAQGVTLTADDIELLLKVLGDELLDNAEGQFEKLVGGPVDGHTVFEKLRRARQQGTSLTLTAREVEVFYLVLSGPLGNAEITFDVWKEIVAKGGFVVEGLEAALEHWKEIITRYESAGNPSSEF